MAEIVLLAESVPSDLLEFFEPINLGNRPSVLKVSSQGYPGAHFATFSPKLIEPMILAGTSAEGCCVKCGAPWERITEKITEKISPVSQGSRAEWDRSSKEQWMGSRGQSGLREGYKEKSVSTIGWQPTCKCGEERVKPCVVLDPFIGSGTTAVVAVRHGRAAVGIDLSEVYLRDHAIERIEGELLRHKSTQGLSPRLKAALEEGEPSLFDW